MFQGILKMATLSLLKKWLNSHAAGGAAPSPAFQAIHPNTDRIKVLAVKYVTFAILAFLNFQLFVGGVIVTAVAIAHSFDIYNEFQPSSVFWTGVIIAFTALAVGGVCGYLLVSTKVTKEDLVVTEAPEFYTEPVGLAERLVRPFIEGVLAGLRQPRYHRDEASQRRTPAA